MYSTVLYCFFGVINDNKSRPMCNVQINGIAYDWASRNLYWTDGEFNLIGAVTTATSRKFWKPIVTTGLTSPQDIVVDPTHA